MRRNSGRQRAAPLVPVMIRICAVSARYRVPQQPEYRKDKYKSFHYFFDVKISYFLTGVDMRAARLLKKWKEVSRINTR